MTFAADLLFSYYSYISVIVVFYGAELLPLFFILPWLCCQPLTSISIHKCHEHETPSLSPPFFPLRIGHAEAIHAHIHLPLSLKDEMRRLTLIDGFYR